MIVVSFFTDDWEYPRHGARLKQECVALGLRHRIERLPSTGSYLKNCCMKPAFIQRCLLEEKEPVLWLDVDASILAKPDFFSDDDPYDLQAKRMGSHRRRTWHMGTMWWAPTDATFEFIERWIANTGECSEESSMEYTWRQDHEKVRARDIPQEYFSWMTNLMPGAVIGHRLSASESKRQEVAFAAKYEQTVI